MKIPKVFIALRSSGEIGFISRDYPLIADIVATQNSENVESDPDFSNWLYVTPFHMLHRILRNSVLCHARKHEPQLLEWEDIHAGTPTIMNPLLGMIQKSKEGMYFAYGVNREFVGKDLHIEKAKTLLTKYANHC